MWTPDDVSLSRMTNSISIPFPDTPESPPAGCRAMSRPWGHNARSEMETDRGPALHGRVGPGAAWCTREVIGSAYRFRRPGRGRVGCGVGAPRGPAGHEPRGHVGPRGLPSSLAHLLHARSPRIQASGRTGPKQKEEKTNSDGQLLLLWASARHARASLLGFAPRLPGPGTRRRNATWRAPHGRHHVSRISSISNA